MLKLIALIAVGPLAGRFPALFYPLGSWFAWLVWKLDRKTRRNVIANLLPATNGDAPAARAASLTVFQNVARYYVDLYSLPRRPLDSLEREHMKLTGERHLAVLDEPGPIVLVSAHTGTPELAVQALLPRGRSFVALVEPLRPRRYAQRFLALRSSAGGQFHEADLGGLRRAMEALRAGGLVAVMGDRDLAGTGVCTDLLGRRVRLARGPWELARRAEAVILPVFSSRGKTDDLEVWVEEPFRVPCGDDPAADIAAAAQQWASLFEAHLRRQPGQWLILEDFWRVHGCG